ncbi:hypothetical protein GUITHDRAFT_136354 [Guillardia theta CCMP2712]|uniref:Sulfotransferase domain-containing protein n=2 Tax=Guillardia theta TaxID=55529 RepID=L1JL25_GUITC|nr:hypothetical protein GUITHDRAFT_136354 [Guillardia theta CCMP2712]EKX49208.1 hypothetical protein GUITHDRAFT_136354 [Guillardia theta CCMP2712]|mmetsp:Transcript_21419/g.70962  ORF Transcript_21419/g.70962 Transcript_21419/m.70962 type:complete len:441 (+) Transcript_21419:3-1325(+)|eukprot:XP_005836188.1 hypothetical protein GUITHDRAFT_136354 [Guillardia theta CCMP2712]
MSEASQLRQRRPAGKDEGGGISVEYELEELELERKRIELELESIQLKEKEMALKRRKAAKEATGGFDVLTETDKKLAEQDLKERRKLLQRIKDMQDDGTKKTQYKLLLLVVLFPLISLAVIMPIFRFMYEEKILPNPCQGICDLTPDLLAKMPKGCVPENPQRVFFMDIPTTGAKLFSPPLNLLKNVKEWELVNLRSWRDAVYAAPVYLSPASRTAYNDAEYEVIYRKNVGNLINSLVPHRRLFFGSTYVHDDNITSKSNHNETVRYITLIREPLARLQEQFEADREHDQQKGKSKFVTNLNFEECLHVSVCRTSHQFSRWCNLQTRYFCGWGKDCLYDKNLNATEAMLKKALHNIDTLFLAVGIFEDFDLSHKLLETLLPTYFQGLGEELKSSGGAGKAPEQPKHLKQEMMRYCWADMALYEHVKKKLAQQAKSCKLTR